MTDWWRRWRYRGVGAIASLIVGCTCWVATQDWSPKSAAERQARADQHPVLQLERISELVPLRVHVTDILMAEGEGYRGSWLIKGDALLTCDVSKARFVDVDPANRTAKLLLPPPRVISARIDFDKTVTWRVEKVSWLPWTGGNEEAFRRAAMIHAQYLVERTSRAEDNFNIAKDHMQLIIWNLYKPLDWKIDVAWSSGK